MEEFVRKKIREAIFIASRDGSVPIGILTKILQEELGPIGFQITPPLYYYQIQGVRKG